MKTQAAGVTFRSTENEAIKTLRDFLEDEVLLIAEPENKYDKKAVRIEIKGVNVGYLPKNSDAQKAFHEDMITSVKVDSYLYSRGEAEDGTKDWNSEHEGELASITLDIKTGYLE